MMFFIVYLLAGIFYVVRTRSESDHLPFGEKIILAILVVLIWPGLLWTDIFFLQMDMKKKYKKNKAIGFHEDTKLYVFG